MKLIFILIAMLLFLGSTKSRADVKPTLYWENTTEPHPERAAWSDKVYQHIDANFFLYDSAQDIKKFCPKYVSLSRNLKLKVHGEIIVGVVFYESAFNPASRMVETTMSTDPITGRQVASEGLLQLSYQDMPNYGSLTKGCGIDWSKDKGLKNNDKNKTIFNPLINLECGLRIYENQLKNKKLISVKKGNGLYWSVLRDPVKNQTTKVPKIAARVQRQISLCK